MRTVKERLLSKVSRDEATGCWNWTASVKGGGYGQINVDGATLGAHRLSYKLHKGPIPDGIFVCHHCDNKLCINPDHLFLGTAADNSADMMSKGREVIYDGENHGSAKLTEADVLSIRNSTEPQRVLGARYGISGAQICKVRNGKQWAKVGSP